MGVTGRDIFGDAPRAEPATPGSYGVQPAGYRLPDATRLGQVRLQVADLARSLAYYEGILGMRVLGREGKAARLGAHGDERPLVELNERRGAKARPPRSRTGLYHFALLLPDRPSLGRLLMHLADKGARAGSADHLVSESLYLRDPDNLGIEVYADRPRDTWRRVGRELMMATDPLDVNGLIEETGGTKWSGMPGGTVMGHLHLHVGDIPTASAFYSEALGLDRMVWQYPGALFLAAGGYHHSLGTNTWAGPGATPSAEDESQLLEWTVELPDAASLDAVEKSLRGAGHPVEREAVGLMTRDPWKTALRILSR